jgi:pyrimidine-nucleoside phosphorylase
MHIIYAKQTGYINKIHALAVGKAGMLLGAGRQKKDDVIDYSVGVYIHQKVGDKIKANQPLFTLYHNTKGLKEAIQLLEEAVEYSEKRVDVTYIYDVIK